MQQDEIAERAFLALKKDDERKKEQFAALLQKRKEYRALAPATQHRADSSGRNPSEKMSLHPPLKAADKPDDKPQQHELLHKDQAAATTWFALVVVSYSFRHLPALAESTKAVATTLFNTLMDSNFNRFARRGSKLLLNPSVIELQDTMTELRAIYATESNPETSSFFMCLSVSLQSIEHSEPCSNEWRLQVPWRSRLQGIEQRIVRVIQRIAALI